MTLWTPATSPWCRSVGRWPLMVAAVVVATAGPGASAPQTKPAPPVAAAALQKLLPSLDGWTRSEPRVDEIVISPEAKYTYASATFTKDDFRVRFTLADTGTAADSLMALATMVTTLPQDYSGQVQASTIKRVLVGGSPASELWDGSKGAGELTVVVGGRFVVKAEASKVDSPETLRGLVEKVDLQALAALK